MPSVFNHENSYWGMKKPPSNLLQCDFIDESQTRKLNINSNLDFPTPYSSNAVNFSVSSNGYYGYQPHNKVQEQLKACDSDLNAMDVDIGAKEYVENQYLEPAIQNSNRKRQLPGEMLVNSKRIRQDLAEQSQTSTLNSAQGEGVGARNSVSGGRHSQYENEATAELLRQTHGCEAHLYDRICDY